MATLGVKNASASTTVTPQLSVTTNNLRVRESSADAASTSAATCSANYNAAGVSQITALSGATTAAAATYRGHGDMTSNSGFVSNGQVTRGGTATVITNVIITASARYKWLDAPEPTTTWTPADYLERAA
jgi:hypothetical protein